MITIQTYSGKKDLNSYVEELSNPALFFTNINHYESKEMNHIDVSTFIDWDDLDLKGIIEGFIIILREVHRA